MTAILTTHSGKTFSYPPSFFQGIFLPLIIVARHLPHADQVIVLDKDGSVDQIGSFQQLNARKGYVQSLAIHQPSSNSDAIIPYKVVPTGKYKPTPPKPSEKPNVAQTQQAVKTHDKATYRFYFKPIGLLRVVILAMVVLIFAFLTRFQRKYSNVCCSGTKVVADDKRHLGEMVDGAPGSALSVCRDILFPGCRGLLELHILFLVSPLEFG